MTTQSHHLLRARNQIGQIPTESKRLYGILRIALPPFLFHDDVDEAVLRSRYMAGGDSAAQQRSE